MVERASTSPKPGLYASSAEPTEHPVVCWLLPQAVNALKAKLRKEWEDQQAESRRSSIAKVVIMVIGVIGGLFVCGGPILFLVRALRVRALTYGPRIEHGPFTRAKNTNT